MIYLPESFDLTYKSYLLKKFDILLIMVGASVGKMGLVTSNILPALQNQNMWRFRSLNEINQIYLKYLLTKLVTENVGSASGSAREFFRKDFFRSIKFTFPNDDVLIKFSKVITPMFEKLDTLQKENENLTQTRDLLLPKLLSGKIRIN